MGLLDRILGRTGRTPARPPADYHAPPPSGTGGQREGGSASSGDARAIARYRYLLRTAPPEAIEQAHAEAFAQLTPQQREQVLAELSQGLPSGERLGSSTPEALARAATRAEMRQPGTLERAFGAQRPGGTAPGLGMGGVVAGSMLGTIAGVVVGSAVADSRFGGYADSPEAAGDPAAGEGGGGEAAAGDGGDLAGGDAGGGFDGGFGGDVGGDLGGDFGSF